MTPLLGFAVFPIFPFSFSLITAKESFPNDVFFSFRGASDEKPTMQSST